MDDFVLSSILLNFKADAEHYAVALVSLLEPSWLVFAKLAFLLLILGLVIDNGRFFGAIFIGLLWLGLTHVLFLYGWEWMQSISDGVRHLAGFLGAPAYDPSAIIQLGAYVADPLLSSVANQGLLSWARHPVSILFALAGLAVFFAFCVLALVQFAFLLMNYLLIGAAPFFLLWLCVPGVSAISQTWLSLAAGNLSGLFICGLIAGHMQNRALTIGERYQLVFADAVSNGVTLTWSQYAEPLGTAFVLAFSFAFIPYAFSRVSYGIAGNLLHGGALVFSAAAAAISIPSSGGGSSNPNKDDGGQKQIESSQGRDWGGGFGGALGQAQEPAKRQWS